MIFICSWTSSTTYSSCLSKDLISQPAYGQFIPSQATYTWVFVCLIPNPGRYWKHTNPNERIWMKRHEQPAEHNHWDFLLMASRCHAGFQVHNTRFMWLPKQIPPLGAERCFFFSELFAFPVLCFASLRCSGWIVMMWLQPAAVAWPGWSRRRLGCKLQKLLGSEGTTSTLGSQQGGTGGVVFASARNWTCLFPLFLSVLWSVL